MRKHIYDNVKKASIWVIAYTIILFLFTLYVALDTFVIPRAYVVVDTEASQSGTQIINAVADTNTNTNTDTDADADADADTSTSTSTSTSTDSITDTVTDTSTKTKTKTEPKIDANTSTDISTDTDTNSNTGTDADADTSADSGADTSTSADTDPDTSKSIITDTETKTVSVPEMSSSSYSDGNISIKTTEYRENDTDIYVADISLSSADYLKTAFADNTYGKNIKAETSVIAAEHNAIIAVDGDFYGARNGGYVMRNGTIYREISFSSSQEDLVIYSDGSFGIVTEGSTTPSGLLESGALQVLSFGPGLVDNGEIIVTANDEVAVASASNPRTAIGIMDNLHYIMVVSDGRTKESKGLTLYDLAAFMKRLGVITAYNLDGGGSATMYFNGNVINNPTENGRQFVERRISDIVYIGY